MLRQSKPALHCAIGFAECFFDQDVAESRDFGRSLGERRDLKHIAQHNSHVLAPLEPGQQQRVVPLEGTGAKSGQRFGEFFVREAAVELLFTQKGVKQVSVLDQGFAQISATPKHRDGIVSKKGMGLKEA